VSVAGLVDKRSPLAKALGGRVAYLRVRAPKGRLADVDMAVRSLPQGEITAALRAALRYLTEECGWKEEHLYTELGEGAHDGESQLQVLAKALVVPPAESDEGTAIAETCEPLVASVEELRLLLMPDEIAFLFQAFARWQQERSPISRARSAEEVEAYVDALGKGVIPISWLKSCDNASLLAIATELAVQHMTSTNLSSSDTSPSSEPNESGLSTSSDSETGTMTTESPEPSIEVLLPRP